MKKIGVLHAQLSRCIATLGHMDLFLIGDAGMPIPSGVEIVDLALCKGVPTFSRVLATVLQEACVEHCYLAEEIKHQNPTILADIQQQMPEISSEYLPHSELKTLTKQAKFAIRTGECSPYANVVLRAGVSFD